MNRISTVWAGYVEGAQRLWSLFDRMNRKSHDFVAAVKNTSMHSDNIINIHSKFDLSRPYRKSEYCGGIIVNPVNHVKKNEGVRNVAICLLVAVCCAGTAVAQDEGKRNYSGRKVYRQFCAVCHGPRGQGSPLGKPLNAGEALALTDAEMIDAVYEGRPDEGMMAFGTGLSRAEIERVTEYVRKLQGRASQRRARAQAGSAGSGGESKADVRLGEELFTGKAGCMRCHSYYTRGGLIGPALDGLASRLSAEEIREAVASPAKTIVENFGGKEIETKPGAKLRGRFRYETEDTVQLLNTEGTIWTTYFKKDLRSVAGIEGSLMPEGLLTKLSKHEQAALFAFLATLK